MVRSWDVASDMSPVDVRPILPDERAELVGLLAGLDVAAWARATLCPGWSVHDVALHLLGNDLGRLDRPPEPAARSGALDFQVLARRIEHANDEWVRATRRISPEILVEFLAITGLRVDAAFARLGLHEEGVAVAWTGTGPSPYWLDIAREYAERWVHHQHIRLALGRTVLSGRHWLHPVLAAFMCAMPVAYESTSARAGTRVAVVVDGAAGGRWLVRRGSERWHLLDDDGEPAAAEVRMDAEVAWRLLTRLMSVEEARPSIVISGNRELGVAATRAVAVMTTRL
jgi:uncharacterized protein (TIGR03083 family)